VPVVILVSKQLGVYLAYLFFINLAVGGLGLNCEIMNKKALFQTGASSLPG